MVRPPAPRSVPTPASFLSDSPLSGAPCALGNRCQQWQKQCRTIRSLNSEMLLPHKARLFTALPGPAEATPLLAEIATAPCPFTPVTTDAPLALYGAGNLGRLARDFLKTVRQDFVMAIDRNARRLAGEPGWAGVPLLHPDEVTETARRGTRLAVSVVTAPYVPLE